MTTHELSLPFGQPDASGDCYPSTLDQELTLTNSKKIPVLVMAFPTGSDIATELAFTVPQTYASTPQLVIRGAIDGTPANTLAFGVQILPVADTEAVDAAYEAEDLANIATWTGYSDEDLFQLIITLTPSALAAGDTVFTKIFRDDSVDNTTFNVLIFEFAFRYSDT